jgi:DNA polymerase V
MANVFVLCDANNFYVSCERCFNAALVGRPVVVLSNNDGCIVARSNEARAIPGLKMGVPLFKVQHLIDAHNVQVFSSNYALYSDMSSRVMSVLGTFTPEIELYSIDEAFMRVDAPKRGNLTDFGREIKEKVYKETGVPLSVGVAETKTLAKLANHLAKKSEKANGVLDLTRSPFQDLALERTPVEEVWGIGRRYTKFLHSRGITNAKQLRDVDAGWARQALTVVGARIVQELRGVSCMPIETCPPPKKSLTCSRSFGRVIESHVELREAVATFTVRVAERLRKNKLAAGTITVFVSTNRFSKDAPYYENSATVEMAYPTDATTELLERAAACAARLYREGYKFKKAGVLLNGLVPASPMTIRMQDDEEWQRSRRVMRVVDEINAKFGRDTVSYGITGFEQNWKTKFEKRSQRFTTNWNELLAVA